MTAIVDLTELWLNSAADPTDARSFDRVTSLQPGSTVDAQVRVMASGRRRLVRSADRGRSYAWKLEWLTRDDVDWLEDHIGDLLCVRDDRGRKWFGVYTAVTVDESTLWRDKGASVDLSLSEVTHSEAV